MFPLQVSLNPIFSSSFLRSLAHVLHSFRRLPPPGPGPSSAPSSAPALKFRLPPSSALASAGVPGIAAWIAAKLASAVSEGGDRTSDSTITPETELDWHVTGCEALVPLFKAIGWVMP